MQFLTRPVIASKVVENLKGASEVSLAVAYFSPDQELMHTLCRIPHLTLVVSDEFAINDPYKLEVLSRSATVRCIPADCPRGRLHAKVMITRQSSGQLFALVGSANLTWQGIFSNQEACVALESREASDLAVIGSVANWFDTLLENSQTIDFPAAKRIFNARSQYTLEPRMVSSLHAVAKPSYWALKCTSGAYGKEHWQNFLADGVVAVGWPDIDVDPSAVTRSELSNAIAKAYEHAPVRAADTIKRFIDLNDGDVVVVCRGYPANSSEPVIIHGFARITGPFYNDRSSRWLWRFKRAAVIQPVNSRLPKEVVATALQKGSLLGTLNPIDRDGLYRLAEQLGVSVNV